MNTVNATVTRLLDEMRRDGVCNPQQQADVLAQTSIETSLGTDMVEPKAAARAYEGRADLGNTQKGDGVRFRGRGFVQITGRAGYAYWSKRLGVDLVGNPQLAARPDIAAKIAVLGMRDGSFTGRKLADYTDKHGNVDFYDSREIVNGHDKAGLLRRKAAEFLTRLRSAR